MKVVVLDKKTIIDGVEYPEGSVVQVQDGFSGGKVRKVIQAEKIEVVKEKENGKAKQN